jgi:hypothetical protein
MSLPATIRPTAVLAALAAVLAAARPGAADPGRDLARDPARDPGRILVVVRATAGAHGPFVRLDEVAELAGSPSPLLSRTAGILLGFSPEVGALRRIEAAEVEARILEAGIPADRFQLIGASRTEVFAGIAAPAEDRAGIGDRPPPAPATRPLPAPPPKRPRAEPPSRANTGKSPAPAAPVAPPPGSGVEKGQTVVIRSSGPALLLEESGRALASAGLGETVEVTIARTGRKLAARVAGPGTVIPVVPTVPTVPAAPSAPAGAARQEGDL